MIQPLLGGALVIGACWAVGRLWRHFSALPPAVAFGLGAASLSTILFLLVTARVVSLPVLIALNVAAFLGGFFAKPRPFAEPVRKPADPVSTWLTRAILAAYGVLYFVHTLAPEIQPDAITYHLGLPAEYLRRGGFPNRVGFYEILPQGMEILYLWAFAFGGHSAAKLVHFSFLLATVPLLIAIARRMGFADRTGAGAAVLYVCAPVVGVSGTSAYTDAALVFFSLSAFYLLLLNRSGFTAGLVAGFCYAIKISALIVPAALFLFVLGRRKWKEAGLVAAGAAVVIAPWMLRSVVVAQNPVAPLLNRWIPNPHFHPTLDQALAQSFRSYDGFEFRKAPFELTLGGAVQGIFGPVFLLVPLGLLALRDRRGRWLWAAAGVLAVPWFFNVGARFLMPSVPLVALALAGVLPRPALWAVMALHAALSWPAVVSLYELSPVWRLHGFPLPAALRMQSEEEYLDRLPEYRVAQMIQSSSRPGEKVFALMAVPTAYVDREVLQFWHSSQADSLFDTLRVAGHYRTNPIYRWGASFEKRSVRGVRFRLAGDHEGEWCVHDVRVYSSSDRIYPSPQWLVTASPNPSEARLAFDGNLATRWRTWRPLRAGMDLQAVFDRPHTLTAAEMISHTPVFFASAELHVLENEWSLVVPKLEVQTLPNPEFRTAAVQALRREGFHYILTPSSQEGAGPLGEILLNEMGEWGISVAGQVGGVYLLRLSP